MQAKWIGDVGDFAKLALLRWLAGHTSNDGKTKLRVGICWCLNDDMRGRRDLTKSGFKYLQKDYSEGHGLPGADCRLWSHAQKLGDMKNPSMSDLEDATQDLLDHRVEFVRLAGEQGYLGAILQRERNHRCEVVFLDPDNGIKLGVGAGAAGKEHVAIGDIKGFLENGRTVVVYQHANHKVKFDELLDGLCKELAQGDRWTVRALRWHRQIARAFIVAMPQTGDPVGLVGKRIDALVGSGDWHAHFTETTLA
ncbi:MAG TPA: hypothetical protein PK668_05125 [Myxococcota bacterium]|nr:hypothetical protein [Myxococcota bacterium]HRY92240.1 hypothetical protein [Myxococcota bacterium]